MSLSSKAISTLWLDQPRFQPPAAELLPATIQRTPHFELAQRPRKSCLSLIPVSVPPSFVVISSRVVLPDWMKSRLIFSMAPELPFVRVGARSGSTRQPWQGKHAVTSATQIAAFARRQRTAFPEISNALLPIRNLDVMGILLYRFTKGVRLWESEGEFNPLFPFPLRSTSDNPRPGPLRRQMSSFVVRFRAPGGRQALFPRSQGPGSEGRTRVSRNQHERRLSPIRWGGGAGENAATPRSAPRRAGLRRPPLHRIAV